MLRSLILLLLASVVSMGFTVKAPASSSTAAAVDVLILPVNEPFFTATSTNKAFLDGWNTSVGAEVYGYTATDDLWTLLNKTSSAPAYEKLRIFIQDPYEYYSTQRECLKDIQVRSYRLSTECQLILR